MLNRFKTMTLCGQMSAITFVLALAAALGVAAWTGNSAGLKLAGAIVLVGGVGLLLELFGPKRSPGNGDDTEHDHAR